MTLGYPDGDSPLSDRLSADAIIHRGHYRDYSDEVIKSYYAEKESRDDSKRFVEENGKSHWHKSLQTCDIRRLIMRLFLIYIWNLLKIRGIKLLLNRKIQF